MSVGPAADVFALGAVLYHMLSGRPPFVADDMISTLAMITDVDPTPLAEARPTAPRDLDRLLDHALAKPPEARPSAEMLAEGLARIRRGEPLGWGGSSVWRQALYRVKRRDPRALLAICVALVLGVVLGSGGLYARYTRSRQAATADLQEHLRWEERSLTPLRLGLLGSDLEEAEVSARAEAVAALAATLGEPTSDAALARVRAYQRWLRFRAGGEPDIPAGRSSARPVEHLVVDARILRAQGKHEEARRRLLDLQHPAARLLELQLQADQDPHTFLERLPGLQDSEELAFARSLAPQLFATQWEQVARRACSADDQGSLHRLAKAAEALPPDLALRVAETKRRALDAAAPDWTRALLAAVGRKRDDVLLQRLQRLLDCAPAVRPGPALEAACSAALSAVLDAEWAALNRRDEEAARRVLRAEDLVFSLAPARREVRRMRIAIEAAHIRFKSPPGEWVVQRVRYGRISDSNTLPAERLSLIESRYSADCPLLAVLRVADRLTRALLGTRRASLADTLELLDAAEAALEVEDVRAWVDPRFEAKLLLDAMTMVYLHDKRHPGHVEREAATRRGLALVQRARRALLEDGINAAESADDLLDIYEFEARFQDALGRAGGAIEVWGAACARFEELARTTQEKPFQREYNSQLTKALEAKAEALLALGRAPEALAACDEIDALRKQLSTDLLRHDDKGRARGLRVRAHRLLGDLKTAQAVIEAGLPQALESPLFFGELVHTYVAAGRADEALRLCDEALREDRSRNWRAQLLTLRRLALSSKSRKR